MLVGPWKCGKTELIKYIFEDKEIKYNEEEENGIIKNTIPHFVGQK